MRWFSIALLLLGCGDHFDQAATRDAAPPEPPTGFFRGAGIGDACAADTPCRDGLSCEGAVCVVSGDKPEDARCLLSAECEPGFLCGWAGFCVAAGEGVENSACSSTADCSRDFYCALTGGLAGQCQPIIEDAGDIDDSCEDTSGCMSGLVCSPGRGVCTPGSVLLNPDVFRGVSCDEAAEAAMPFGIRHRLPRADRPVRFYGFPFPTDVRKNGARVDMSEHPTPGDALTGEDAPKRVLDAISAELRGWSLNAAVYFRFTHPINPETVQLRFVDLDRNLDQEFDSAFVPERNKYICHNFLYVHPKWSRPLRASTTYAVVVSDEVRSTTTEVPTQLDELPMLLADEAPTDADDARAWRTYAKLRTWLATEEIPTRRIVGATVFTTEDPYEVMRGARAAVSDGVAPSIVGTPTL